eukprot:scaffold8428_cov151-Skeletonema_menzelii.AAC.10
MRLTTTGAGICYLFSYSPGSGRVSPRARELFQLRSKSTPPRRRPTPDAWHKAHDMQHKSNDEFIIISIKQQAGGGDDNRTSTRRRYHHRRGGGGGRRESQDVSARLPRSLAFSVILWFSWCVVDRASWRPSYCTK